MKSSIPLAKVVAEAVVLGVYQGESARDIRLILFLARSAHGSWTVGGRFPSIEEGLLVRLGMPYRTFRNSLGRLVKARVVTTQRLGHSITYALSSSFLLRCRTLYEIRFDLPALESYHNANDSTRSSGMTQLGHADDSTRSSLYRAQEEHANSATANAARPDGRAEEGHLVSDFDPSFYDATHQAHHPLGW